LQQLKQDLPDLNWDSATDVETIDLLEMLENDELDYILINSSEFTANKSFYPRIKKAFRVGETSELAWALPQNSSPFMQQSLTAFFDRIKNDGTLEQLIERFYSHQQHLTQIDSRTFARAVEQKLPKYEALIRTTAKRYNLDWRLLAAISYQESHWNPRARSHTGVRGMMMLTLPTAREMNIRNRLDPAQSLDGGARYFKKTLVQLPTEILEPDRTWMALAAYNVGRGHLLDARSITERRGGDPNRWADVKDNLPLLSQRRWYTQTRYGYARGSEPVQYVQNIRHFYNYLEWAELSKNRKPPPKQMDQYVPGSLDVPFNAL
jgi:membrane-bound lytic murein transglycosylase F